MIPVSEHVIATVVGLILMFIITGLRWERQFVMVFTALVLIMVTSLVGGYLVFREFPPFTPETRAYGSAIAAVYALILLALIKVNIWAAGLAGALFLIKFSSSVDLKARWRSWLRSMAYQRY